VESICTSVTVALHSILQHADKHTHDIDAVERELCLYGVQEVDQLRSKVQSLEEEMILEVRRREEVEGVVTAYSTGVLTAPDYHMTNT